MDFSAEARKYPWRKVVARRPALTGCWEYSIWEIETLECGHEHETGTRAGKRRCWQCGKRESEAAGERRYASNQL